MYFVTGDELYLIPTAEVPVTNFIRDEILSLNDLPLKRVGYTPAFAERLEVGVKMFAVLIDYINSTRLSLSSGLSQTRVWTL